MFPDDVVFLPRGERCIWWCFFFSSTGTCTWHNARILTKFAQQLSAIGMNQNRCPQQGPAEHKTIQDLLVLRLEFAPFLPWLCIECRYRICLENPGKKHENPHVTGRVNEQEQQNPGMWTFGRKGAVPFYGRTHQKSRECVGCVATSRRFPRNVTPVNRRLKTSRAYCAQVLDALSCVFIWGQNEKCYSLRIRFRIVQRFSPLGFQ